MFGFKKELYTPEYQLAGDECAVIETSKGTIKVKLDGEGAQALNRGAKDGVTGVKVMLGAQAEVELRTRGIGIHGASRVIFPLPPRCSWRQRPPMRLWARPTIFAVTP